jgi:hypothetical protein
LIRSIASSVTRIIHLPIHRMSITVGIATPDVEIPADIRSPEGGYPALSPQIGAIIPA